MSGVEELARLITAHRAGDENAFDQLVAVAYKDIHALAHRERRRGLPVTLNTTALAHEVFLRLAERTGPSYSDPAHFFAVIAKAMRYILIDYARSRTAAKRGGDWRRVELTTELSSINEQQMLTMIAVDEALLRLAELNAKRVQVVECRYFAGLTEPETASALGISLSSVQRHWRIARAQLRLELEGPAP
jgi:RNA polymerase sigma factor (TIGR02999 family)